MLRVEVVAPPRVVSVAVILPRPRARLARRPREEVVAERLRFVLPCGKGKLQDNISGPENNLAAEQVVEMTKVRERENR